MNLKKIFKTYFDETSFEYVVRKITRIPLRGDGSLANKAELNRLKKELLYYFLQNLDEIKKKKDLLDLKFGSIYFREYTTIIEHINALSYEAISMLQQSLNTKEIIDPMPRNKNSTELEGLKESYNNTFYRECFIECIMLIDNHIATL